MPSQTPKNSCWEKATGWISCRQVLNMMVLTGFMFNYMLRVNFTIAIVAMVATNTSSNATLNNTTDPGGNAMDQGDKFEWDAYMQNILLGCFFWGYICTELPGGRMAEVFGARRIFGYSMMLASVITVFTPAACDLDYVVVVIILRVILGFLLGATWPAIPPMIAKWVPPLERSKFMANMMASSLGAAITLPICGFLIEYLGWRSVFYATGAVGLVWSTLWFLLIHDSPAQHPRISDQERHLIEDAIGTTGSKKALPVPWKNVLTSSPVWAIIITHACSVFGYFTVVNQLPTYSKYILQFDIKKNGLMSSLPYLGKYISALVASHLADYLRRSGKLSTTATRKIFTTFAVIGPGALMILQIFFGEDKIVSIAVFTIGLTINGAVVGGYFSNGLDIAPNFSGTIFGLANTLSSIGGFLSTLLVGSLTKDNQTFGQWQIVFAVLTVTYVVGGLSFLFFGRGELQPWNNPDQNSLPKREEETIPLKNGAKA